MDLLYLPPSLRRLDVPLVSSGAGGAASADGGDGRSSTEAGRAAPVEYDLVEALRPAMTVDLGTGDGGAFFSLCQSARTHDVDGLFYGIDEWAEGDLHAGVNNFMHSHFRGIAYLLRVSPEGALRHFPEGSIELLRIDVARLGRPLAPLLEAYGPRVAPGGVVLCAGLCGEDGSLAAWTAFASGRDVLVPGDRPLGFAWVSGTAARPRESELLSILRAGSAEDRTALGEFYAHVLRHLALRAEVEKAPNLFRKKS